jgi:hypothetical protein
MAWQIEQPVDFRHGNALGPVCDLRDRIACSYFTFLQDTQIEAGPVMSHNQSRHFGVLHPDTQAVTRHSRLRHFEEPTANPVLITDADLVIRQTFHSKVLAKLSVREVPAVEVCLPVAIGVHLVHHHRSMLTSVAGKISLSVASQVQPACHHPALHESLPDAGVDRLSSPRDVSRESDVN